MQNNDDTTFVFVARIIPEGKDSFVIGGAFTSRNKAERYCIDSLVNFHDKKSIPSIDTERVVEEMKCALREQEYYCDRTECCFADYAIDKVELQ